MSVWLDYINVNLTSAITKVSKLSVRRLKRMIIECDLPDEGRKQSEYFARRGIYVSENHCLRAVILTPQ